jgi:hypothetical protein
MADKLRREKDIVRKSVDRFVKATSEDYSKWFEGSPTYITYYQLCSPDSSEDNNLEDVHSLVGPNTPNKYKRIYDVVIYGVDTLDISNEINERGLQANITGECVFLPDSIRPYPGDFFIFDTDGMEDHLFKINDVQYDKATAKKFFRCQFSIYQQNSSSILDNIEDDYELQYNNIGGQETTVVKKTVAVEAEKAKAIVDDLIKRYTTLFYDEDTDTFICQKNSIYYWSPYLQHFLNNNHVIDSYNKEILTDIYVSDINEIDFPNYYKEDIYRNSIFRNIENQNKTFTFSENFITVPGIKLKDTRNLPFFCSALNFAEVAPISPSPLDVIDYTTAYALLFNDKCIYGDDTDVSVDEYHKIYGKLNEPSYDDNGNVLKNSSGDIIYPQLDILNERLLTDKSIKAGDLIYEFADSSSKLIPTGLYYISSDSTSSNMTVINASLSETTGLMSSLINTSDLDCFYVIKDYLNNKLVITDTLLTKINDIYFKPTISNYILMPILIYVLKQTISDTSKDNN